MGELPKKGAGIVRRITGARRRIGSVFLRRGGGEDTPVHTMINTLQITLQQSYLFQLIYTGKTTTSRPNVDFPDGFFLSQNEKHWPKAIKQRPFASLMTFRI